MANVRSKIVVLLVIYFAGFATAIYTLAPPGDRIEPEETTLSASLFRSDKFARSFSAAMHKYAALAREAAETAAEAMKDKWPAKSSASGDPAGGE